MRQAGAAWQVKETCPSVDTLLLERKQQSQVSMTSAGVRWKKKKKRKKKERKKGRNSSTGIHEMADFLSQRNKKLDQTDHYTEYLLPTFLCCKSPAGTSLPACALTASHRECGSDVEPIQITFRSSPSYSTEQRGCWSWAALVAYFSPLLSKKPNSSTPRLFKNTQASRSMKNARLIAFRSVNVKKLAVTYWAMK